MAEIISFPAPLDTIVGRVVVTRGLTDVLGWTDAAERGYLIGYMDAQNGKPSAIASIAEYQNLVQRLRDGNG